MSLSGYLLLSMQHKYLIMPGQSKDHATIRLADKVSLAFKIQSLRETPPNSSNSWGIMYFIKGKQSVLRVAAPKSIHNYY